MSRRRARPSARSGRLRRVAAGDRVYGLVIVGVVALVAAMALGPLQSYTAAADRVERLAETRDLLREEVDALEERRELLHDPDEVELMARSQIGLVKPGEAPYVVVAPERELDRLHPAHADMTAEDDQPQPWYRQVGRWLQDLVGSRT